MVSKSLQLFISSLLLLTSIPIIASRVQKHDFHSQKPTLFNHLQGSRKGDNVRGIHNLKLYLQRFGYLSNIETESHDAADDTFDDLLESAIKTYQKNFNLDVSGVLDAETTDLMGQPRCGVPDININGDLEMGYHSHYTLYPGNLKWPPSKQNLTYKFINNYPDERIQPVIDAFTEWSLMGQVFSFVQVEENEEADMKISFEKGDHGDGAPFDGRGGILAHAFAPTDGRLHFDEDEIWVEGTVEGASDLGTVALHEIGHLLGLRHTTDNEAIMWPIIPQGIMKSLAQDDIDGIQALYPNNTQAPPAFSLSN